MPNCCQGATCACKVDAGTRVTVTGTGQAQDPFVISADVALAVTDNTVFDLTLNGTGTVADPWNLQVSYAATAKLDDIPDVDAPSPTNGQVLAFNTSTLMWEAAAPTTAASGSVQHDTSLSGDGSVGTPLEVNEAAGRMLETTVNGLGLTDDGMSSLVLHFTDAPARDAMSPAPVLNQLTTLDTNPGIVEYWTGVAWAPVEDNFDTVVLGGEFMQLSGAYTGTRKTLVIKQVSETTDGTGIMPALTAADLTGYAGVLTVQFQPTGAVEYDAMVRHDTTEVQVAAFRMDTGAAYAGQALTGTLTAWLY